MGGWGRLHNEGLHNLYAPRNIITVTKFRRIKWVGHKAHKREIRNFGRET